MDQINNVKGKKHYCTLLDIHQQANSSIVGDNIFKQQFPNCTSVDYLRLMQKLILDKYLDVKTVGPATDGTFYEVIDIVQPLQDEAVTMKWPRRIRPFH